MTDRNKTKSALIAELQALRQQRKAQGPAPGTREVWFTQFAIEHAKDAIWIMDSDARIVQANNGACNALGYTHDELLDMKVADVDPDFPDEAWPAHWQNLKTQGALTFETRHRAKDGRIFPVEVNANFFEFEGKEYNCAFVRNISARRASQLEQQITHEKYKALFENIPIGLYRSSKDGIIEDVNQALLDILGYPDKATLMKTSAVARYVDRNDHKRWQEILDQKGIVEDLDAQWHHYDGSIRWIRESSRAFHDAEGKILYYEGVVQDITEQTQALVKLEQEQQRAQNYLDIAGVILLALDFDGTITMINRRGCEILGYQKHDLLGRNWFDLCVPSDIREAKAQTQKNLQSGETPASNTYESYILTQQGLTKRIAWYSTLVHDAQGKPSGTLSSGEDITERVQSEAALRFTQFATDHAADGAFWMGVNAHFVYVNEAACKSLGYTHDELLSMTVHDISPEFPQEAWKSHWDELKQRKTFSFETIHQRKDGSQFPVEITVNYVEFEGKPYNCAFARNISEQQEAEAQLRESEARFRELTALLPQTIYEIDLQGNLTYANEAAFETFGYTREEYEAGLNNLQMIVEADRPRAMQNIQRMIATGEKRDSEFTALHKDGSTFPILIYSSVILHEGAVRGIRGIIVDITEQKRAENERQKFQEQMQQTQKLEGLGVLAGGIAHDFNNLLMGILGNADLAMHNQEEDSTQYKYLNRIIAASTRAADLCRQMLAYAGKGKFHTMPVKLNKLISEMGQLLCVTTSKKALISYHLSESLPIIMADATQIQQIIMNLITNASEAIGDSEGAIVLTTDVRYCNKKFLQSTYLAEDIPQGDYVFLQVKDDGCGMDAAVLKRIFDPFFTTKFTGRGLGLAAVMGIVRSHNGALKIDSTPNEGTTFEIYLPVYHEQLKEEISVTKASNAWRGTGTILVVDDENTVLDVTRHMIQNLGFTVLTAHNGREAIDIFQAQNDEICCVVLDLTMPQMDGDECYRELQKIRTDVRVLLSSGHSEVDVAQRFAGRNIAGFIQKPFKSQKLAEKLQIILG